MTKFILKDYVSDYKSRLFTLDLLPLSLWMEMLDVLLFVKLVKFPPDNFSIFTYISFVSSSTRSSSSNKIKSLLSIPHTNTVGQFYFNRLPRIWNALPSLNLDESFPKLKKPSWTFIGTTSLLLIVLTIHAPGLSLVHAITVCHINCVSGRLL